MTISNNDKLAMIGNLATLLKAGIPIPEAVESLIEDSKGGQKKVLVQLKNDLNQGKTIAESLEKSNAFDPVTVNLIKAAEEAGTLDETLKDMVVDIKKDIEFNDKVKGAMAYPILVVIAFVGVLLLILVFVVPRIASVFSKMKVTLPITTQILIAMSNFTIKYAPFLVIAGILVTILSIYLYKTRKRAFVNLFTSLPLLSNLAREIDLARFSRSMSLLLSSGIPITNALELSQHVVWKKDVARVLHISIEAVTSGKKLSDNLSHSKKTVPVIMIRIIEAGEKTGTLDKSMQELADYFETRVSSSLKVLTTMLEPMMLLMIGLLAGGMMMSVMAPIYGLISQIQAR